MLDEVSLFLHLIEENRQTEGRNEGFAGKLNALSQVLNGKTVLIADDDVRNIFSLTKTLEQYDMAKPHPATAPLTPARRTRTPTRRGLTLVTLSARR